MEENLLEQVGTQVSVSVPGVIQADLDIERRNDSKYVCLFRIYVQQEDGTRLNLQVTRPEELGKSFLSQVSTKCLQVVASLTGTDVSDWTYSFSMYLLVIRRK